MVLRAAKGLYPLAVGGTGGVNIFGDRSRTDKTDRLDTGIVQQGINRLLITVDYVQNTWR